MKATSEFGSNANIESPEAIVAKNVPALTAPQYTEGQLTTVPDSPENALAFENRFYAIFANYFPAESDGEMVVFKRAVTSGNESDFAELRNIASQYRLAIRDLLALPVPVPIASLHRRFINAISYLAAAIDGMADARTDDIAGVRALQAYLDFSNIVVTLTTEYSIYFSHGAQSTAP